MNDRRHLLFLVSFIIDIIGCIIIYLGFKVSSDIVTIIGFLLVLYGIISRRYYDVKYPYVEKKKKKKK